MSVPPRRRRWIRRIGITTAAICGVLAVALLVVWWKMPTLVRDAFLRGAADVGMDHAAIEVERADLAGLRATDVLLRKGGLEIKLAQGAADYSVRGLLGGRVGRITIDGLALSLDFTKPRRGVLPDAVADLQAAFASDDALVWPVDAMTLKDCQLVLVLPGGPQSFIIHGAATRGTDGRVTFNLHASDVAQVLEVHGTVRTETMDGELVIERLGLEPGLLLGQAAQLGLLTLPVDMAVDADRIEISGTATLKGGLPETCSGRIRMPAAHVSMGSMAADLMDLTVEFDRRSDQPASGKFEATLSASDSERGWSAGPTTMRVEVAAGRAQGGITTFPFLYGDSVRGRAALQVESGVPALGGEKHATVTLTLDEINAAGMAFAPVAITTEGWKERISLAVPRLALAEDGPVELSGLAVTIHDAFSDGRALDGSADITATSGTLGLLPKPWAMIEPALPATAARVSFSMKPEPTGPVGLVELHTVPPLLRVTGDATDMACAPQLDLTVRADARGASLQASARLSGIDGHAAVAFPPIESASFSVELPHTSYASLSVLAQGRMPTEDLSLTLRADLAHGSARGHGSVVVRRDVARQGWTARVDGTTTGLNGALGGIELHETGATLVVDSGLVADQVAAAMLGSDDFTAAARALIPQIEIGLNISAAAIEVPGQARVEWAGFTLAKPPAREGEALLSAKLTANAGILRSGPETIEQPAIALALTGDMAAQDITAQLSGLIEGSLLKIDTHQRVTLDMEKHTARGSGSFALQPFSLTHSDIVSRWAPDLKGVALSATLAADGELTYSSDGAWDGTAAVHVSNGVFNYAAQDMRVSGLFADVAIESLARLQTAPGQQIGFSKLTMSDIDVTDARLRFRTASSSVVHVEGADMHVFGGTITAEPFSLYFPDADVALDLRMKDLDAGALVRTFDLFRGSLTGRLQGRLPIGLLAGSPIIGEGYLELQPEFPATLSVDTGGLFTQGLPNRTALEKVNRLPNELLEAGLANLELRHFRIDLFRRDRPDRPIEIVLGGTAHTERADVPIELKVNLNGSMSEVIEMLMQLITL